MYSSFAPFGKQTYHTRDVSDNSAEYLQHYQLHKMKNSELLEKIYNSTEFKDNKTCFHYANRGFFTFIDDNIRKQIQDQNGEVSFAVHNFNGDREVSVTLYFTEDSENVRVKNWDHDGIKIANNIFENTEAQVLN